MAKPWWMWILFLGIVLGALALDLGLFYRRDHRIGVRESLRNSVIYIALGLAFGGGVWFFLGPESGVEYLTGFLVEKSLSLDNLFVMVLLFRYFRIPPKYQHRVLCFGILGVIFLRAALISLGSILISRFSWMLYLFGLFLVGTGIKMLWFSKTRSDIQPRLLLSWIRKVVRVTPTLKGHRFFVQGRATPLFLALVTIELSDLIFAIDSVPAIFAITTDPYLVYTSNIFAILGLRALYFAIAEVILRFYYLKHALALLLIFIGSKIWVADWLGIQKFPTGLSLGVTLGIILGGVLLSFRKNSRVRAKS